MNSFKKKHTKFIEVDNLDDLGLIKYYSSEEVDLEKQETIDLKEKREIDVKYEICDVNLNLFNFRDISRKIYDQFGNIINPIERKYQLQKFHLKDIIFTRCNFNIIDTKNIAIIRDKNVFFFKNCTIRKLESPENLDKKKFDNDCIIYDLYFDYPGRQFVIDGMNVYNLNIIRAGEVHLRNLETIRLLYIMGLPNTKLIVSDTKIFLIINILILRKFAKIGDWSI